MQRLLQFLLVVILLFIVLGVVPASFALSEDGNNPQIALSVVQASPGATIEIWGGRFQPDIFVTLVLAQNGTEMPLGKIIADDHGEFTTTILLPMNLQTGAAEFRGIDEKNRVAVAPLTVVADESGQEQSGQRSEEDPLFAPMPNTLAGASTAVPPTPAPSQSLPAKNLSNSWLWIVVGVGIVVVSGFLIKAKR